MNWYQRKWDKFCWWLVSIMPKQALLFAFVTVYGADGECPEEIYKNKYDFWATKHNVI